MYLKVTLFNGIELFLNMNEIVAWRPYNAVFDAPEQEDCSVVDLTSGGNFRLSKESSILFATRFEIDNTVIP